MKDFDAVEMMRSIREKLHRTYTKDPTLRMKRLDEIRKKYPFKQNKNSSDIAKKEK